MMPTPTGCLGPASVELPHALDPRLRAAQQALTAPATGRGSWRRAGERRERNYTIFAGTRGLGDVIESLPHEGAGSPVDELVGGELFDAGAGDGAFDAEKQASDSREPR